MDHKPIALSCTEQGLPTVYRSSDGGGMATLKTALVPMWIVIDREEPWLFGPTLLK